MKKFLFTLATLLMASSAFAIDLVVADVDFTEDQIGKQQLLPLSIVLDNEYVNGWEMTITYPEGVTAGNPKKNTAVLNQMVPNADGDEEMVTPLGDATATRIVQAYGTAGYWDPDEDGTFESYGAVKIGPTGTFKLYDLRVTPSADFKGGDIVIEWMITGGFDHRNGQTGVSNSGTLTIHLTVPAAQPAPEPTFRVEDGKVYAEAEGHELSEVKLFRVLLDEDGQEMSRVPLGNPFTLPAAIFDEDQVFNFVAYTVANENESANSAEVPYQYTVKKKEDAMPAQPTISFEPEEDGTVTVVAYLMYYGQAPYTEYVDLYLKNAEGEWEKVDNPYTGLPSVNNSYTEDILYEFMAISRADGEQYNKDGYPEYKNYSLPHLTKADVDSPSIVGMNDEDGLHFTISIIPGTTDGQLIYSAEPMGTLMRAATVNIQYERKAEDYYVDVDAYTTEGATYAESAHETAHVRVPALPQTAKPSVTYSYENGKLTVWAYGSDDDAVYTLYCDGEKYTGEMPITYDIYEGYGPHTWTATAIAPNKLESEVSDPVEITIDEQEKVYQTPAPVIGEPVVTAENVTFTVTGQGTVTVTVTTSEGTKTYTGEEGSVTVVLPRGEEYDMAIVNATAKANEVPDGYDAVAPGRVGPEYIDIPAKVYSAAPVIVPTPGKSEWDEEGNQTVDGHYVVVTFEAVDGAEVYYRIDGEDDDEFVKWDGTPIYFRDNGDYTIEAYAVEPGKMPSEVVPQSIHVTEATSVNGLVNGKTVAGVRYFNMAGQEMQEANGVTIVVTTYTDGTTSAVKVIK